MLDKKNYFVQFLISYLRFYQEHIDNHPKLSGATGKKTALKKFFKLEVHLYGYGTEEEVKKAIDYEAFRTIFSMNEKTNDKKHSKTGKKAESTGAPSHQQEQGSKGKEKKKDRQKEKI